MNARTIQRIRAKLTYANVTATLALVLALGGGTAWAASKIRNGAVRTDDVKDGSLQAADLAPGAVPQPEATIWGVVTSAGALASGEGVTSAVPGNTGVTTVTFPHDVSRCAVVASVGGTTPEDERQNAAGIVHAKPGLAPEQVTFTTRSLAADNPVAELPFHFIVDC